MKYKYEDWKTGVITLIGTWFTTHNGSLPITTKWSEFDSEEQKKIRNEQNLIFHNLCQDAYDLILNDFSIRYEKSHFKEDFVKSEIEKLKEVLFGCDPNDWERLNYSWVSIHPFDGEGFFLQDIRMYFRKCYIEGYSINYDFVNSPESPYNLSGFGHMPEVQGEVLYKFYCYICQLKSDEPILFDKKYWNLSTFHLFIFLSEEYVHTQTITKYNLIYHFLKSINQNEDNSYYFSMKKAEYFEFIKNNISNDFISSRGGIPTMNPPETDEKSTAFSKLKKIQKDFEAK